MSSWSNSNFPIQDYFTRGFSSLKGFAHRLMLFSQSTHLFLLDDKFRCKLDLGLLVDMTETISSPVKVMDVVLPFWLAVFKSRDHLHVVFLMNCNSIDELHFCLISICVSFPDDAIEINSLNIKRV